MQKATLKAFLVTTLWRQNNWHTSGVFGHTVKVVYQVIKSKDYRFLLPALLHDIGKPFTAYQKPEDVTSGQYSFTDHEERSYQIIKNWPVSQWTKDIVRWHYLIRDMAKSHKKGDLPRYWEKSAVWDSLSDTMKDDLATFLKYDDIGKKVWKDQ